MKAQAEIGKEGGLRGTQALLASLHPALPSPALWASLSAHGPFICISNPRSPSWLTPTQHLRPQREADLAELQSPQHLTHSQPSALQSTTRLPLSSHPASTPT